MDTYDWISFPAQIRKEMISVGNFDDLICRLPEVEEVDSVRVVFEKSRLIISGVSPERAKQLLERMTGNQLYGEIEP